MRLFLMVFATLLTSACSVFGHESVETARYTALKTDGAFEIREYAPFVVAETTVEQTDFDAMSEIAFNRLFRYISGNNKARQSVAMTAPVLMQEKGESVAMTAPVLMQGSKAGWTMAFVLPASYTIESAPVPADENVRLRTVAQHKVAALRFSGFMNAKTIARRQVELIAWVESQGLKIKGEPQVAGYNPPWTIPALRRNEILVAVE